MESPLHVRIEALLAPIAEREGFELVAVETAGATKAPVVRVYVDQEGGLGIDSIVEANRWISAALDGADPIPGSYTLEVSSPGVDRPLTKIEHFERFCGETAKLKTRPLDGRSAFRGTITGVEDDVIVLDCDGESVRIPLADVTKARLKGTVDFNPKGADE